MSLLVLAQCLALLPIHSCRAIRWLVVLRRLLIVKSLLLVLTSRQDKSSTHSDHGDQNDGPFEDEEIVLSVGQQEEFWGELQAQENEEKITLPDEAGEMIKRPRLFGKW